MHGDEYIYLAIRIKDVLLTNLITLKMRNNHLSKMKLTILIT